MSGCIYAGTKQRARSQRLKFVQTGIQLQKIMSSGPNIGSFVETPATNAKCEI